MRSYDQYKGYLVGMLASQLTKAHRELPVRDPPVVEPDDLALSHNRGGEAGLGDQPHLDVEI